MAISLWGIHELLEGRDQRSGHHLITCFSNEQRGCFLHEAELKGVRVISRHGLFNIYRAHTLCLVVCRMLATQR